MKHLNFGGNITLTPRSFFTPKNEHEVIDILNQNRRRRIRCIGRLHSWSSVLQCDDVLLDLRYLNDVRLAALGDSISARIGGGCQIKQVLAVLERQGWTLPSVGFIAEQTVAGAISTGTHGSGRHSLSHYVTSIRVARYDRHSEKAVVEEIKSGDELRAARCSLGCMGVILSVTMECRPLYYVEEHFQEYDNLGDVLRAEKDYPLQQFYLVPWRWTYIAQHRREWDTPVLLYLHGQDATRGKHLDHTERFRQLGLNVLAIDYRGFAETYGEETPREATVYEDAEAALEYLTDVMKIPSNRIFIYGHSLGGAVAIELATREEAEGTAGVIVESTFTSISEMSARRYYGLLNLLPVDFLLTERFDSLSKIDLINRPLLIIHGTQDLKVPYKMSERLCAENKSDGGSAELCLIDGAGHENCGSKDEYKYRETLKDFVATALKQADLCNAHGATDNEASIGKSTPASQ